MVNVEVSSGSRSSRYYSILNPDSLLCYWWVPYRCMNSLDRIRWSPEEPNIYLICKRIVPFNTRVTHTTHQTYILIYKPYIFIISENLYKLFRVSCYTAQNKETVFKAGMWGTTTKRSWYVPTIPTSYWLLSGKQ